MNKIGFKYYGFDLAEVQLIMLGLLERIERLEKIRKPNELELQDLTQFCVECCA